jgi:hypothetical protein
MNNMVTTTNPPQKSYYHEDIDFAALLRSNDGRIDWQDPLAIQYVSEAQHAVVHIRN